MEIQGSPTVALCVIARNKRNIITNMLDSTKGVFHFYVLQDTGSDDDTVAIFEAWCQRNNKKYATSSKFLGKDYDFVNVNGRPVLAEFDKARNDSFQLAREKFDPDFCFWLDTDDVIVFPEKVMEIASHCAKNDIDFVLLKYEYGMTNEGLKLATQWRERLINMRKPGAWHKPVHETYNIDVANPRIITNTDVFVVHQRSTHDALDGGGARPENRRNNQIMVRCIEREGLENVKGEVLYNLAFDHFEYGEWDSALKYFFIVLDRHKQGKEPLPQPSLEMLHTKIARCFIGKNDAATGVMHANLAIQVNPKSSEGYLVLMQASTLTGNVSDAAYYADRVIQLGMPGVTAASSEYDYKVMPVRVKVEAALREGKVDEAARLLRGLLSMYPSPAIKREYMDLQREMQKANAISSLTNLYAYYVAENKIDEARNVIRAIPTSLRDNAIVRKWISEVRSDITRKTAPVTPKSSYSIVIFAGPHYESWDGNSDTERGIGGSEGMCIQMARELAAIGNKVFVYNECGSSDGKVFDQVTYLHYKKWNPEQKCDIFISLRKPELFGSIQETPIINAKRQYLWLHDTYYGDLPLAAFHNPNSVFVLSHAHKEVIMAEHGVTDSSIFYLTRNSLNKVALDYADKNAGKRDPFKVVYASSYDRGLDNVLKVWPQVKERVPQATLDIYYGWNTYDAMMAARANTPAGQQMRAYKQDIIDKIAKLDGVRELGRIPQNELYKRFSEAAIWFYPTQFYEISCITAMTAHATGAVPVCTPYAALKETVHNDYSFKAELPYITNALVYALENQAELEDKRQKGMQWARERYDATSLAKEWMSFFNSNK